MLSVCIFFAIFGIYLYFKKIIIYLKFKFYWVSCILSGTAGTRFSHSKACASFFFTVLPNNEPYYSGEEQKKHITYTALPNTPVIQSNSLEDSNVGGLALDWSFLAPPLSHLELPGWRVACCQQCLFLLLFLSHLYFSP